ncbi:GGDEF domain-containing protein [Roseateles asaccharophilus]|uniref:diguanylate cyclase n=1 Tax=Roseateles asaccharophilus TaxID=582607 RepID=A0ABU2A6V3_9BURK|nr:GGDEF domain-containing protein [Roseateles asaccharophilus]MDR7332735.1 diguanylate cyclase (GGDEF)-like protein [Roseateles asaccharophilus]
MDVITLLVAVLVNALLMSLALAVGVGIRARSGLQAWQFMLLGQAAGFGLLIAAKQTLPVLLATLGVMVLSASASAMTLTVCRFLGQPVPRRWLCVVPLTLGAAHWAALPDQPLATVVTNLTISLQILWASGLLLRGAGQVRWRWLCGVAAAANALLMLGRAVLAWGWPEAYPRFTAPHPLNLTHLMLLNASLVLGTMGFLLAHRDAAEQALVRLASLDTLTGLLNRREWMSRAGRALGVAGGAADDATVLMMLDLDHFKQINDQRGHPAGDEVLKLTGEVLRGELRASDLVGRYGGEEFCLLLRHSDPDAFGRLDMRLHQTLRRRCEASLGFAVDFSAGVVRVQPGEALAAAIARADDQLYRAKHAGRGRTCSDDGVL